MTPYALGRLSKLEQAHALELYPFRYRDSLTGKWIRAGYVGQRHVITERDAEWEITGPAEISIDVGGSFNPFRGTPMQVAHVSINETPPIEQSSIDD